MFARIVPVLIALLAGILAVPAPAAAGEGGAIFGAIDGSDGRAVNALIGFDFLDAQGRRLRRDGCVQSPECPLVGYASVLNINEKLPAEGSTDREAHATTWRMDLPAGTAQVFIEAYPRENYRTTETRYGHAMRHSVKLPHPGPVDVHLPLVLCGEGGTVGSLSGNAVRGDAPLPLKRVVAWGLDPYDVVQRPIVGWNIGTARSDGTFVVPNLPPDQRYQVWLTAEDGSVKKTFGVVPRRCTDTAFTVPFDPPPPPPCGSSATATACTSPSPAPKPLPPSSPTIDKGSEVVTSGGSATMTGAARAGQRVELWAYSRPSSTYRLVRATTAAPTGLYAFTVTPPTDTRLRVRVGGLDSPSVVIGVRHAVRMTATRLAPRSFRFTGTVWPKRAGVRVDVVARTPSGLRVLTSARTRADGRWSVDRRFTGTATWNVHARSAPDGLNRSGAGAPVRLAIR